MDRKINSAIEIAMQQLMETNAPMRDAAEEANARMAEGKSPMQALFGAMLNAAMLIERERYLEAGPHERAEGRQGYANGFKSKRLDTTAGTLHLSVPKTAQRGKFDREPFYPSCLEKGMRCERALMLTIAEMYVRGVSTRRIKGLLAKMGIEGISSSQVSRAAKEMDVELERWRERPLGEARYLQLDARYEKMRDSGVVRDVAVLTAVGVEPDGKRRILGVSVKLSEAEVHWRDFLDSLVARGLRGVEFITSDDHAGLGAARRAVFPGAKWQRCQFHLAQNAFNKAPAKIRDRIGAEFRAVWNAGDAARAQAALNELVESCADTHPAFAEWLEGSIPEGLAVFDLPDRHSISMRTSNPMERAVQQELKRRTTIVRVFPSEESLLRLCTAVLIQIDEQWASGTTYIKWERQDG